MSVLVAACVIGMAGRSAEATSVTALNLEGSAIYDIAKAIPGLQTLGKFLQFLVDFILFSKNSHCRYLFDSIIRSLLLFMSIDLVYIITIKAYDHRTQQIHRTHIESSSLLSTPNTRFPRPKLIH